MDAIGVDPERFSGFYEKPPPPIFQLPPGSFLLCGASGFVQTLPGHLQNVEKYIFTLADSSETGQAREHAQEPAVARLPCPGLAPSQRPAVSGQAGRMGGSLGIPRGLEPITRPERSLRGKSRERFERRRERAPSARARLRNLPFAHCPGIDLQEKPGARIRCWTPKGMVMFSVWSGGFYLPKYDHILHLYSLAFPRNLLSHCSN